MIALIFWIIGILTILVQTTLLQELPSWFGRPDFLFILLIFISYRFAWIPGIFLVFSLSWIMNVIADIYLGYYPLVCLLLFTIAKTLHHKTPLKESSYQIPLLGTAYFTGQIILTVICSFAHNQPITGWQWGQQMENTILLMIIAIPMFALYNKLLQYLIKRQMRKKNSRRTPRKPSRLRKSSQ